MCACVCSSPLGARLIPLHNMQSALRRPKAANYDLKLSIKQASRCFCLFVRLFFFIFNDFGAKKKEIPRICDQCLSVYWNKVELKRIEHPYSSHSGENCLVTETASCKKRWKKNKAITHKNEIFEGMEGKKKQDICIVWTVGTQSNGGGRISSHMF